MPGDGGLNLSGRSRGGEKQIQEMFLKVKVKPIRLTDRIYDGPW